MIASEEKERTFNCFFQSRKQVVVRRRRVRRIGWVIKILEAEVNKFFWFPSARWGRAFSCENNTPSAHFPRRFPLNARHLHQQSWITLRVDSLALWNKMNEEDANLIRKNVVLRTLTITMTRVRMFLYFNLMALCHSQVTLKLSTDINITETTYFCQFQYEFGNQ